MEYGSRVARAIALYTKGLKEMHPFDRFSAFWIGLETLNGPLKELLNASEDVERCVCGRERKLPTLAGIREFMKSELKDGALIFKRTRGLRVTLTHSTKDFHPLLKEATDLSEIIRDLLRKAIIRLLGSQNSETFHHRPIANVLPYFIGLEGNIKGIGSFNDLIRNGDYPHLAMTDFTHKITVGDDMVVSTHPSFTYKAQNLVQGSVINVEAIRHYGEDGKLSFISPASFAPNDK